MTVAEAVRELTEAIKKAQLELPGVSTDDVGKALMVDAEGKWVAILPTPELPDTTGASEGDVLTVGSSGLEWGESGGGLTLYGPYFAKNNSQESVETTGTFISLDKIFNLDENEVSGNNNAVYLLDGFNLAIIGVDIMAVSPTSVFATSLTGSNVTVGQFDCSVSFYSTIELQPATP